MRKLILSVVLTACAFAQAPQIADTVTFKDTRSAINTALSTLYGRVVPNPFTTRGDLLFQGTSAPSRLAVGINGQCLLSNGTEPYWGSCLLSGGGTWGSISGTLTDQTDLATALAGKSALAHAHAISDVTNLQTSLNAKEAAANKGQANGYAPLGADGLIPSQYVSAGTVNWGSISGTLASQADLAAALAGKEPANANVQAHIASTSNPHSVTKTQVGLSAVTNDAQLKIASNLADLNNVGTARTNLGLGDSAVKNTGTLAGTVAAGDHNHTGVYSPVGHPHAGADITSGTVAAARLGSGTTDDTTVLYGDGVWRTPPGASGGEANTASNTGSVGVGLYKQKTALDLEFYKLNSANNRLSVALSGTDRVDLTINESNIVHQNLSGAGTNTHAQIDSHIASTSNPHNTTAAQAGAPALTLLTTLGDTVYRDGSGWQRLAGNTVAAKRFLSQTGNGATSAAPAWSALVAGDIPDISATYQPLISAGTTAQYWRGDKSWQTLDKTAVGLPNVDNTSDANKPVSTATATALAGKEPALGNPASNGYVLSSTTGGARSWVAQASHTQNTDTGTSSSTFQIGTGGPKWKNNGGVLEARNAADDGYVPVTGSEFRAPSGTSLTLSGAEQAAPTVSAPTLWFDSTAHLPQYKSASDVLVGTMVAPLASRTANQFVTHIDGNGVAQKAGIAAADLPAALANSTSINGTAIAASKTILYTDTAAGSFPTLNQNTSGTAANLSGTPALPNGTTATTQSASDNSTKLATTAYADAAAAARQAKMTLPYGCAVGDPAGSALSTGVLCYVKVPMAGTITGWSILVDGGTATVDVWKVASGSAKPTVANTITASAKPAIASGTAIDSTTLTSWTTSVAANDWIGFNLDAVATSKYITVAVNIAH